MYTVSKRGVVRWIVIPAAIITVLGILLYNSQTSAVKAKQQLEYGYLRAIQDLSVSLEDIKTTLNKGMYTNSETMMSSLSSKLWGASSAAKASLAQLPVEELNLENTYKFLSQVGDYSGALASKLNNGEEVTAEERENFKALYEFALSVSNQMWTVENQLQGGYLTFEKVAEIADHSGGTSQIVPQHFSDGFKDVEDGFSGYPTLIYDGPFSDHIMQREPIMLKNTDEISQEEAYSAAVRATGITGLELTDEENGKMPSYIYKSDSVTIGITKQGGFLSYMLNYRFVEDENISVEQCIKLAKKYLEDHDIKNVTDTYFETEYGVCIINFASVKNGVVAYTDLIKVGVAMDSGDIISYDARGYLTNHQERELNAPKFSAEEAKAKISDSLTVEKVMLTVIPSSGLNEKFCYELKCVTDEGQQILIYINAETGGEEQILLLRSDDHGMLTI